MSTVPESSEATVAATTGQLRPPAAPTVARGTEIGRYMVLGEVGRGAMGLVLAAYDADLDRKVAIKLAFEPLEGASERRQRLLREAQAMAKIGHVNVVSIHDVGTFEDRLYLAMEFVDGCSLRQWCAAGRTQDQILDAYMAAAQGLAAAHQAGVIHRDFKPDNVLVDEQTGDPDGAVRVRVADFGLAMADDPAVTDPDAPRERHIVGTPAYMAPEHHRGGVIDARTDQFAFCVALFEALYGRRPFTGDTLAMIAAAVLAGRVEVPDVPRVSSRVRRVVLRGLAVRPEDRHGSMTELLDALTAARRPRWRGPLLVVAAFGLASLAWWLSRDPPPVTCIAGVDRIAAAWDPDERDAPRVVPGDASPAFAVAERVRLRAALDDYGAAWAALHDQGCVATSAPAAAQVRARTECLEDRLASFTGIAAFVTTTDVDAARVDELIATLPQLSICEGEGVVARRWDPTPADPELAVRVGALRERLQRASLTRRAGRELGGEAELRAIVEEARATGFDHLIAASLRELSFHEDAAGATGAAGDHLDEALGHALLAGSDLQAAAICGTIVRHLLFDRARTQDAEHWTRLGRAWLLRGGGDDAIEGEIETNLGRVLMSRGQSAAALRCFERAEQAFVRAFGEDSERRASAVHNQATAYHKLGESARAWARLDDATSMIEPLVGRDHPSMISLLQTQAAIANRAGRTDDAIAITADALGRATSVWGSQGSRVGALAHNLAYLEAARGRLEAARAHLAQARAASPEFEDELHNWTLELLEAHLVGVAGDLPAAVAMLDRMAARVDRSRVNPTEYAGMQAVRASFLVDVGKGHEALALVEELWPGRAAPPEVGVLALSLAAEALLAAVLVDDRDRVALWLARLEGIPSTGPEDAAIFAYCRGVVRGHGDAEGVRAMKQERDRFAATRFDGYPLVRRMDAWLAGRWPPARAE